VKFGHQCGQLVHAQKRIVRNRRFDSATTSLSDAELCSSPSTFTRERKDALAPDLQAHPAELDPLIEHHFDVMPAVYGASPNTGEHLTEVFYATTKKATLNRLCKNMLKAAQANAPTCPGRFKRLELLAAGIARIGGHAQFALLQLFFGSLDHGLKLLGIHELP